MKTTKAEAILKRYQEGTATQEEKAWVENWYSRLNENKDLLTAAELQEAQQQSWKQLEMAYRKSKPARLWPKLVISTAAALALVFGIWFFNRDTGAITTPAQTVVLKDVAPGKNAATLILPNGQVIDLSDQKNGVVVGAGNLKYDDDTKILNPGQEILDSKPLEMTTGRGQTYIVTLPDGTKVWLNADSKIFFPSQFSGSVRKILLKGEAYFEVAKNKAKPFIVETRGQQVEVLGTHFNINSYSDEASVKTTLLEGSVRVSGLQGNAVAPVVLKPGQQAMLMNTGQMEVKQINVDEAIAWKNGRIIFNDADMQTIMKDVARWYDLEVSYKGAVPKDLFTGGISRKSNLSSLLKMLELNQVKFRIETIPGKTTKKLIIQE